MLHILELSADAAAAVLLNGQPAGELTEERRTLQLGVCEGALLLQLFPAGGDALPQTAVLEVGERPRFRLESGGIRLYLLPEGLMRAEVRFCRIAPPGRLPYLLARTSGTGGALLSVYYDRCFCFSVESMGRVLLSGAFEEELSEARIDVCGEGAVFAGRFAGGWELFCVAQGARPQVLLHCRAERYSLSEQLLEYTRVPCAGLAATERYGLRERKVLSRELKRTDPEQLLAPLVLAVREDDREFALSLISDSLRREVSFEDFRAFLGEFTGIFGEPSRREAALCYPESGGVFRVRRLRAEIRGEKIANLEEIEQKPC